jgi:hypothetical protein
MTLVLALARRLWRLLLRCARLVGAGSWRRLDLWRLWYSHWIIIVFFQFLLVVLLTGHRSDQGLHRCLLLVVWRISVQGGDTSVIKLGVGSGYLRLGLHLWVGVRFILSGRGTLHTSTPYNHLITCYVGVRWTVLFRRITWLLLLSSSSSRAIPLPSHWRLVRSRLNLLLLLLLL